MLSGTCDSERVIYEAPVRDFREMLRKRDNNFVECTCCKDALLTDRRRMPQFPFESHVYIWRCYCQ